MKSTVKADEFRHGEYGVTGDGKLYTQEHIETAEVANAIVPQRTLEAPELVRDLTPDQRAKLEKQLLRKIDWRLLPPCIIMYIMYALIATRALRGDF